MRRLLFILSVVLLSLPCTRGASGDLSERLATWMTGSYSNADQAKADSGYRYVVLSIARIWPERTDGPWLYTEQALANAPGQPYRQIVYQITLRAEGIIELHRFDLKDPVGFTNAWREPIRFSKITPADLLPCEFCTICLQETAPHVFGGGTSGKDCPGELPNATYATSEMTVTENTITLWDRGYNARDVQVWGPIAGGYAFEKLPAQR